MPPPIPFPPHLKSSTVLKMLNEGGEITQPGIYPQWPPTMPEDPNRTRPHGHMARVATSGGREVAWPPHLAEGYTNAQVPRQYNQLQQGAPQGSNPFTNPESGQDPNMATTQPQPSGFKLREEAPLQQPGQQTIPSQPAFKITKPLRMRGDAKWPPAKAGEDMTQTEVREFIRPKNKTQDYSEFFAQNALPNSYPGYRAPPGTQHVKYNEEQGVVDL